MDFLVVLLAVLGAFALVVRLVRAGIRFLFASAESVATSGMAEASARRGDLTGLAERRQAEQRVRYSRRIHGLFLALWLLVLILPPLAGWAREVYASAALLWLLPPIPGPRTRVR